MSKKEPSDSFEEYRRDRKRRRVQAAEPSRPMGKNASVIKELERVEQSAIRDAQITRDVHDFFAEATRIAANIVKELSARHAEATNERLGEEMQDFLSEVITQAESFMVALQRRRAAGAPAAGRSDVDVGSAAEPTTPPASGAAVRPPAAAQRRGAPPASKSPAPAPAAASPPDPRIASEAGSRSAASRPAAPAPRPVVVESATSTRPVAESESERTGVGAAAAAGGDSQSRGTPAVDNSVANGDSANLDPVGLIGSSLFARLAREPERLAAAMRALMEASLLTPEERRELARATLR